MSLETGSKEKGVVGNITPLISTSPDEVKVLLAVMKSCPQVSAALDLMNLLQRA
jgi:hypothetical protein